MRERTAEIALGLGIRRHTTDPTRIGLTMGECGVSQLTAYSHTVTVERVSRTITSPGSPPVR
jgi:hypothetical protein